jgi:hypothetical protein
MATIDNDVIVISGIVVDDEDVVVELEVVEVEVVEVSPVIDEVVVSSTGPPQDVTHIANTILKITPKNTFDLI